MSVVTQAFRRYVEYHKADDTVVDTSVIELSHNKRASCHAQVEYR